MHETSRLLLRPWRDADRVFFAQMNADPEVMRYMPSVLRRDESDAWVDRIEAHFLTHRFGLWAVEVKGGASFIGFVGLQRVNFDAPFTPAVEIAWRLARTAWGHGYAIEAAKAVCDVAFSELGMHELVSFTVPANVRSWRVMESIGMKRDAAGDFDHPKLAKTHPLAGHWLYRLYAEHAQSLLPSSCRHRAHEERFTPQNT